MLPHNATKCACSSCRPFKDVEIPSTGKIGSLKQIAYPVDIFHQLGKWYVSYYYMDMNYMLTGDKSMLSMELVVWENLDNV